MKKTLKVFTSCALSISMLLSLTACGNTKSTSSDDSFKEDVVQEGSRTQADWIDKAVLYEVNVRQYTA